MLRALPAKLLLFGRVTWSINFVVMIDRCVERYGPALCNVMGVTQPFYLHSKVHQSETFQLDSRKHLLPG